MSNGNSARVTSASVETDMSQTLYLCVCKHCGLSLFANIVVCHCEDILCMDMGLLSPNHDVRKDGFGQWGKQNNIQFKDVMLLTQIQCSNWSSCNLVLMGRSWHGPALSPETEKQAP